MYYRQRYPTIAIKNQTECGIHTKVIWGASRGSVDSGSGYTMGFWDGFVNNKGFTTSFFVLMRPRVDESVPSNDDNTPASLLNLPVSTYHPVLFQTKPKPKRICFMSFICNQMHFCITTLYKRTFSLFKGHMYGELTVNVRCYDHKKRY